MTETRSEALNKLQGLYAQAFVKLEGTFKTASRGVRERGNQLMENRRNAHHRLNPNQSFDRESTRRQIEDARSSVEERFFAASDQLNGLHKDMIGEIMGAYRSGQTMDNQYWNQVPVRFNEVIAQAERDFSNILNGLK